MATLCPYCKISKKGPSCGLGLAGSSCSFAFSSASCFAWMLANFRSKKCDSCRLVQNTFLQQHQRWHVTRWFNIPTYLQETSTLVWSDRFGPVGTVSISALRQKHREFFAHGSLTGQVTSTLRCTEGLLATIGLICVVALPHPLWKLASLLGLSFIDTDWWLQFKLVSWKPDLNWCGLLNLP